LGFELLPEKFTLVQLQELYEAIFQKKVDKRNFRKKILSMGLLEKNLRRRRKRLQERRWYICSMRSGYEKLNRDGFTFNLDVN